MNEAQQLGLLMLTWCCHRPAPAFHAMTDQQLYCYRKRLQRDSADMYDFVAECRDALAEAEREHQYQRDQLELVEGIIEVRNLNRRDQQCRQSTDRK